MRKVRTRNEHDTWEIQEGVSLWKVPQKITVASIEHTQSAIRVKTGGKSTRLLLVIGVTGKPYHEQGKTVCSMVRFASRDESFKTRRKKHTGMLLREIVITSNNGTESGLRLTTQKSTYRPDVR